jgi:hypothetical protein
MSQGTRGAWSRALWCGLLLQTAACRGAARPEAERVGESSAIAAAEGLEGLDLGEDWATIGLDRGVRSAPRRGTVPASDGGPAPAAPPEGAGWAIVLATATGEGHEAVAARQAQEFRRVDPRLSATWVDGGPRGSMVLLGRYDDPRSDAAQADLSWVKALKVDGRTPFRGAMLSRVEGAASARSPHALLSVRARYPDVDPLYTLQVAAWGAFGGAIAWEDARRRAEAQAAQMRAQGLQAFVHHDASKQMSIVTVGLFGPDAVDPRTGIVSPDVEAMMRRFQHNLVNGEVFNEPIDPRRPERGTRPQTSRLVLVPMR